MNEILDQIINDILNNGYLTNTNLQNLSVVKNEEGDVVVTYKNPANNKDVKEIKKYLDSLDDEIMDEASEMMRKDHVSSYNVMAKQLKNPTNIDELKEAFKVFKSLVKNVVSSKIKSYSDKINQLYDTYLKDEE